ncbi:MAG: ion channel [Cyanobacteriota bacterium]|nr:ion channel [Cyanobacteriota bacterium]
MKSKRHRKRSREKQSSWLLKRKLRIQRVWNFLQQENFGQIVLIIIIIITLSTVGLYLAEPDVSLLDSLWWTIVTLTTVGYGDITPVTTLGRFIAVVDMIVGIGILAVFSAMLASILVDQKIKDDLGMNSYRFEKHIIVCEWNYRAETIIKELRLDPKIKEKPIILIADIERKPLEDPHLFFVRGQVSDETLNRANLKEATTVIILGDDNLDYKNRDAKVILATLTVESINRGAYTIVELVDQAYIATCKRANADEIIVTSRLSSRLISKAALNHGISEVVSDILSYDYGSQLYKICLPKSEIGCSFIDVFIRMKQTYQTIIIGIQKGEEGQVISNPPSEYKLGANDYLIVIAASEAKGGLSRILSGS